MVFIHFLRFWRNVSSSLPLFSLKKLNDEIQAILPQKCHQGLIYDKVYVHFLSVLFILYNFWLRCTLCYDIFFGPWMFLKIQKYKKKVNILKLSMKQKKNKLDIENRNPKSLPLWNKLASRGPNPQTWIGQKWPKLFRLPELSLGSATSISFKA